MMKQLFNITGLFALLATGLLQTTAHANDIPATLAITGSVTQGASYSCSLYLNKSSVALQDNTSTMINQNENGTGGANVLIAIGGNSYTSQCKTLADQGKLAYRFIGTADDADGTVLANSNNSAGSAKGVGVGVFNGDDEFSPLKINQDSLPANSWGNTIFLQMVKLNGQQVIAGSVESSLTIQFERL
ncbi:type 1 fimbrial protein [Cronobacter turicensis]|nr:type 1 fimbrial protein [Cronobacter turicensis]ELY4384433.1 type 1 fimbrial protein [Cronobacter turicensis]ELY6269517.1 type 1 fimbrial protein [Cronobacter turicensis]